MTNNKLRSDLTKSVETISAFVAIIPENDEEASEPNAIAGTAVTDASAALNNVLGGN